jgi:CheY-like chemotaxis protein
LIVGDPVRLRQVLANLVGNAIKFTDQGEVVIRASLIENLPKNKIRFQVQDTGLGISDEQQKLLFQPFSQGDSSTTRKFGGTGLGLAISKRLVKILGGEMGLKSSTGQGSNFWFEIDVVEHPFRLFSRSPLEGKSALIYTDNALLAHTVTEQLNLRGILSGSVESADFVIWDADYSKKELLAKITSPILVLVNRGTSPDLPPSDKYTLVTKPVKQSELYKAIASIFETDIAKEESITAVSSSITDTNLLKIKPGTRILVVEDNLVNQKVLLKMLKALGQTAIVANNGREALSILERESFSLVLMDCQMPEMDGFETTRQIRSKKGKNSRIPIVALTAFALKGDREKCEAAGMDDYLPKPIKLDVLKTVLSHWLVNGSEPITKTIEPDSDARLLDEGVLNALRDLNEQNEPDFLDGIIDTYLELVPSIVAEIRVAVERKEVRSVKHLAHRLRGMSGNLGAVQLVNKCEELEKMGREGRLDGMDFVFIEIEKAWELTTKNLLDKWHTGKKVKYG